VLDFVAERWRSQRAVLWGEQLAQAELTEALHCGLFGEELVRRGAQAASSGPGEQAVRGQPPREFGR